MKRIAKYASIAFGVFCFITLVLGIVLKIYLTKDRVIQLIEEHINARVEIKDISVPLWATLSGVTLEQLKVGYRDRQVKKEPAKRKPMGKPVIGLEKFNFKVAILQLITSFGKKFELKALLLTKPEAHIIVYAKGGTNLDILLSPPPEAKQRSEKTQKTQKKTNQEKTQKIPQKSSEPFSIKSIDTVIKVGKIGIEKGSFSVNLQKFGNTLKLQNVDAYVNDILIDPNNLRDRNRARFTFSFNALLDESQKKKKANKKSKSAVRSFVINFETNGSIRPFNAKTGRITQNVRLKVGLLAGTKFTGLALLKKIKDEAKLLKKAGINLSFLKSEIKLAKDAIIDLSYRSGIIIFESSPRIDTNDYLVRLTKHSKMNIKTMHHNFIVDLILNEKATQKIRSQVERFINKSIKVIVKGLPAALRGASKSLKASTLTSGLLAPAIDKETNRFRLSINSSGSFSSPKIILTKPRLGDPKKEINKLMDKQLKNLKGVAKQFVNTKVEEAKRLAEQKKREVLAKAKAEIDRKKREAEARVKAEVKRKAAAGLKNLNKKFKSPF